MWATCTIFSLQDSPAHLVEYHSEKNLGARKAFASRSQRHTVHRTSFFREHEGNALVLVRPCVLLPL